MAKLLLTLAALVLAGGCSAADWMNGLTPRTGRFYSDIVFAEDHGLALDVYAPRNAENAPVVMFFFPGRWTFGDKASYRFVAEGLLEGGFVVVIPNYRLAPKAHWPDFLEDSARAVRWTHDNIASYGGDPDKLFLMGHSSGAYNAAMIASNERYLAAVGGNTGWVRGMIGVSGPYEFDVDASPELPGIFDTVTVWEDSQPIHFVDKDDPPMLLLHGEDDWSVSVESTRNMTRRIAEVGGRVQTVYYDRMDHGFIIASLSPSVRLKSNPREWIIAFVRRHSL